MKVVWSARAVLRLEQIHDYFARDEPENARAWIARLIERGDSLNAQAYRGRPVPEYVADGVREIREGDYRISTGFAQMLWKFLQ